MRRISQSLMPGLAALLLIACGQTGALYLPDEQAAPATAPESQPSTPDDAQDQDEDQADEDEDEPKQEKEKLGNQELR